MTVAVPDYGAGNLHSILVALGRFPGAQARVSEDPVTALAADLLVLPGVGAFAPAAARLAGARTRLASALAAGHPCLAICLGMQLLFDSSEEGAGAGLGLVPGRVTRLAAVRLPHIGWNTLEPAGDPVLDRAPLTSAWFANGFACRPASGSTARIGAWATHESDRFPAMVRTERTIGLQFHPEKSDRGGVAFLHACMQEVLCS